MQRLFSFRQGDRAEYLAHYILSALAITVPVPRQEDVGIDFHCSLLQRDGNNLRPSFPFNIQIKKSSGTILKEGIRYGGLTEKGDWKQHEIQQLCQTDSPFLVGIVDTDTQTLDLFTTVTRYFILANWHRGGLPTEVALMPYEPEGEHHLGDGTEGTFPGPGGTQQRLWKLPLGQPVARVSIGDSEDPEKCQQIKNVLAPFLLMDQENAVCFRIGLGYFTWPLIIRTGQHLREIGIGGVSQVYPSANVQTQLRTLARISACLLQSYRMAGMKREILTWEPLLSQMPLSQEPEFLRNWVNGALDYARSAGSE